MKLDWQNLAALAVVLLAAVFLTRKLWRAMTSGKPFACSGCSRASSPKDATATEKLISIKPLPPRKKTQL